MHPSAVNSDAWLVWQRVTCGTLETHWVVHGYSLRRPLRDTRERVFLVYLGDMAVECLDMEVSLFLGRTADRRGGNCLAALRARPSSCAYLDELCH